MEPRFQGPVFDDNDRREAEHRGEESTCEDCGRTGVVGTDIHAAFTILPSGRGFPWWICQPCIDKRFPQSN